MGERRHEGGRGGEMRTRVIKTLLGGTVSRLGEEGVRGGDRRENCI